MSFLDSFESAHARKNAYYLLPLYIIGLKIVPRDTCKVEYLFLYIHVVCIFAVIIVNFGLESTWTIRFYQYKVPGSKQP